MSYVPRKPHVNTINAKLSDLQIAVRYLEELTQDRAVLEFWPEAALHFKNALAEILKGKKVIHPGTML